MREIRSFFKAPLANLPGLTLLIFFREVGHSYIFVVNEIISCMINEGNNFVVDKNSASENSLNLGY